MVRRREMEAGGEAFNARATNPLSEVILLGIGLNVASGVGALMFGFVDARLDRRSESVITTAEVGQPEQVVDVYADYAVTPAGALGVDADPRKRPSTTRRIGRSVFVTRPRPPRR
ncbi:MAG TPA: hypothetical protein VGA02_05075 [Gemmatimonadales bacterium]